MLTLIPQGDKLRCFRVALGYTQEELACRAGVSERTVRNAEKSRPLRKEVLDAIVAVLGLPLEQFVQPAAGLLDFRRWERNLSRLSTQLATFLSTHDGSGLCELVRPDAQIEPRGFTCDFEPMAKFLNCYRGDSAAQRYVDFGRNLFDACSHVDLRVTPPQGSGNLIVFRSSDHYVSRCGRKSSHRFLTRHRIQRGTHRPFRTIPHVRSRQLTHPTRKN